MTLTDLLTADDRVTYTSACMCLTQLPDFYTGLFALERGFKHTTSAADTEPVRDAFAELEGRVNQLLAENEDIKRELEQRAFRTLAVKLAAGEGLTFMHEEDLSGLVLVFGGCPALSVRDTIILAVEQMFVGHDIDLTFDPKRKLTAFALGADSSTVFMALDDACEEMPEVEAR